jgi:hypothetical protein
MTAIVAAFALSRLFPREVPSAPPAPARVDCCVGLSAPGGVSTVDLAILGPSDQTVFVAYPSKTRRGRLFVVELSRDEDARHYHWSPDVFVDNCQPRFYQTFEEIRKGIPQRVIDDHASFLDRADRAFAAVVDLANRVRLEADRSSGW